jgi:hypothetical protein
VRVVAGDHGEHRIVGQPFAKGGCGRLYRTTDPAFVYKEYVRADKAPDLRQLERLVTIGRELLLTQGRTVGRFKESSINWPIDLVRETGGGAAGVVLPSIPASCFDDGDVRGLEAMILARANPPKAQVRIALLLRMAEILDYLNQRDLVHGDISGKNLVWSLDPEPFVYLIDCDGLLPREPPPVVGVATPGWTDPRLVERRIAAHDHLSDWYALALALYRGLMLTPGNLQRNAHGEWPRPAKVEEVPDLTLRSMLAAALEHPLKAEMRPAPGAWVSALAAAYIEGATWNTAALAELDAVSNRIAHAHRERSVSATHFVSLPPVDRPSPRPPPPPPTPLGPTNSPPPYRPPPQWQAPPYRPPAPDRFAAPSAQFSPSTPRPPVGDPEVRGLAGTWMNNRRRYHRFACACVLLLTFLSIPIFLFTIRGLQPIETTSPEVFRRGRKACILYICGACLWTLMLF